MEAEALPKDTVAPSRRTVPVNSTGSIGDGPMRTPPDSSVAEPAITELSSKRARRPVGTEPEYHTPKALAGRGAEIVSVRTMPSTNREALPVDVRAETRGKAVALEGRATTQSFCRSTSALAVICHPAASWVTTATPAGIVSHWSQVAAESAAPPREAYASTRGSVAAVVSFHTRDSPGDAIATPPLWVVPCS
jgi:hypothetical protein